MPRRNAPCRKNKTAARAQKSETKFYHSQLAKHYFLFDFQWLMPYKRVSADLSEQLAGA